MGTGGTSFRDSGFSGFMVVLRTEEGVCVSALVDVVGRAFLTPPRRNAKHMVLLLQRLLITCLPCATCLAWLCLLIAFTVFPRAQSVGQVYSATRVTRS